MQSTLALREAMAQLLAADATTLAPAMNANKVFLIKDAFTPSENRAIGDLTAADFDGSTPKLAGTGTQPEGLDPATSDGIITILAPVGGWRWETTGVTNLPQTIYGFGIMDNAGATLYGCETLPVPITLTAVNQVITLPVVQFRQLANTLV